jgi:hypothetical protein
MVSLRPLIFLLIPSIGLCQETTENLIDDTQWEIDGDVDVWQWDADSVIWVYTNTEATVSQSIDLSAYDYIGDIRYGMSSHGCNNTPNGTWCDQTTDTSYYDTITVKVEYGGETYTDTVTLNYNNYFVDYSFSFTATADYDTATISFTAQDVGGWSGYYASATKDVFFELDYNTYTDLILIDPTITNPDPVDIGFVDPIDVADPIGDVSVVDAPVVDIPDITMDMPVEPIATDMSADMGAIDIPDMQIEEIEMADAPSDSDMAEPDIVVEIDAQEIEPEVAEMESPEAQQASEDLEQSSEVAESPQQENKEEPKTEGESRTSMVVRINEMNMDQVAANFETVYDAQAQAVAVALMTMTAPQYEDLKQIPDAKFYDDVTIKDNRKFKDRLWGSIYRDEKVWAKMVDSQYDYGN